MKVSGFIPLWSGYEMSLTFLNAAIHKIFLLLFLLFSKYMFLCLKPA